MPDDTISKVTLSAITRDTPSRQLKPAVSSRSTTYPRSVSVFSPSSTASSGAANTPKQVQSAAANVLRPVFSAPHLTTVAGKSYSLSIEEAAGTFVASVPDPPGTTATGSSAQAAENNLDAKLDTLA
jgi:hypothetical protein